MECTACGDIRGMVVVDVTLRNNKEEKGGIRVVVGRISLVDTHNCLVSVTYFIHTIADRVMDGFSVATI